MNSKKFVGVWSVVSTGAIAVVVTLGLSSGLGDASAKTPSISHDNMRNTDSGVISYARNAVGLTYGSAMQANSLAQMPDLISAIATNGQIGYVKKSDLYPSLPSSPQVALRDQAEQGSSATNIPVYTVDGTTVIGEYQIQPGSSG